MASAEAIRELAERSNEALEARLPQGDHCTLLPTHCRVSAINGAGGEDEERIFV
jgi:hypothetical protein